jgi:dihydroorotase (multifunctional complex type)
LAAVKDESRLERVTMLVDMVIKNAQVVMPQNTFRAGIAIDKEKIVAIANDELLPPADRTIDAGGKYVLPGLIDVHTHWGTGGSFGQSCMTETKAAALGGVTTVGMFGMFPDTPKRNLEEVFGRWRQDFEANSVTDGLLHRIVLSDLALSEIPKCVGLGISSFKFLMGYKGPQAEKMGIPREGIVDGFVFEALKIIGNMGWPARAMVHAENIDISLRLRKSLEHRQDARVWHDSRPNFVEEECINRAIFLARVTKCPLYIVHNTIAESVAIFARAKSEGVDVVAETCPQYLTHNSEEPVPLLRDNPVLAVVNPPLRSKKDNEQLWQGIMQGVINTIGSDHAPHKREAKGTDVWKTLPGSGNITQMILPVMLSEGVNKNRLSIEKVAEVCCQNPAMAFGLYPHKGTISVGSDADIVIADLDKKVRWTPELSPSDCDWSIYDGWEFTGWPVLTVIRGNVIAKDGKIIGKPGIGRYCPRTAI